MQPIPLFRAWTRAWFILVAILSISACGGGERDIRDEVFYFVMPDRFENGDSKNDTGGIDGGREQNGFDPSSQAFYHGGDIKGLMQKLPYLEELGVTSIWMTPIFENKPVSIDGGSAAYHGYWIQDYTTIDPHFGTNKELFRFIKRAQKRGIKVFFDIVINHTADIIRYEECHEADGSFPGGGFGTCIYRDTSQAPYTPFAPSGLEDAKAPQWLNDTSLYHNRGDSAFFGESELLGDFFGLDDLDTRNPEVIDGMVDIAKFWVEHFNIDGFRLDTVKNVDLEFWQQWAPEVRDFAAQLGKKDFFIFGEVFDGDPRKVSKFTTEGELDSALDFGLYFGLRDVFAQNIGPARLADIFAQDDRYTDANSTADSLLSFVSNHDVGRLAHFIREADPAVSDETLLAKMQAAYGLMYFGRGVPVIYYGDEQGFVGGEGDQLNREDMMPSLVDNYNQVDLFGTDATTADANFDKQHPMYETLVEYGQVLRAHPALRRGKQYTRFAETSGPGVLALARVLGDMPREYLVLLNTAEESREVTLEASAAQYSRVYPSGHDRVVNMGGDVEFSLPPLSISVYKANENVEGAILDSLSLASENGQLVKGTFEIAADIQWLQNKPLPLTSVEFFVSEDGEHFESVGTDFNAPYRGFATTGDLNDGSPIYIRAEARDSFGTLLTDERVLEVGIAPGIEVFFRRPQGWGQDINLFYFNTPNAPDIAFPGIPMEVLANEWYRFKFPEGVTFANIIFNDGMGNQTENLERSRDGCYVDFMWVDTCDPVFPGLTISFLKPAAWGDTIFISYFDAPPASDAQVPMSNIVEDWWQWQLPNDVRAASVFFTDNLGNETAVSRREADSCYRDGAWFDECDIPVVNPPNPYGTPLYVRGSLNDWGTSDLMIYNNDLSFTAFVPLAAGSYDFKIASQDWVQADFGSGAESEILLGEPKALVPVGGNIFLNVENDSEYVFELDATVTDSPSLTVSNADVYQGTPIFLRGGMNGWAATDEMAYQSAGAYQVVMSIDAGQYEFKIASEDWAAVDLGAPAGMPNTIAIGESADMEVAGGNFTATFESADYLFTLDTFGSGPVLSVVPAVPFAGTPVFLRGSFNDWSAANEFAFDGFARYSTEISTESASYIFKIASEDWTSVDLGGSTENARVSESQPLSPLVRAGTNIEFDALDIGTYRFELDLSREEARLSVKNIAQ